MKKAVFVITLVCTLIGLEAGNDIRERKESMKYELTPLEYPSSALEPWIDTRTVDLHHYKHQAAYVDKLNAALESDLSFKFGGSLEDLISGLDTVPESIRTPVRNNGGGAWNHTFYWRSLAPSKTCGEPSKSLEEAIVRDFGSFESFKKKMSTAAVGQFGSGWAWLCVTPEETLKIVATPNQDSPIMGASVGLDGLIPIFTIDVWEHAYYLKYQNRRPEYAEAIWNIVNWKRVSDRFDFATEHKKTML